MKEKQKIIATLVQSLNSLKKMLVSLRDDIKYKMIRKAYPDIYKDIPDTLKTIKMFKMFINRDKTKVILTQAMQNRMLDQIENVCCKTEKAFLSTEKPSLSSLSFFKK